MHDSPLFLGKGRVQTEFDSQPILTKSIFAESLLQPHLFVDAKSVLKNEPKTGASVLESNQNRTHGGAQSCLRGARDCAWERVIENSLFPITLSNNIPCVVSATGVSVLILTSLVCVTMGPYSVQQMERTKQKEKRRDYSACKAVQFQVTVSFLRLPTVMAPGIFEKSTETDKMHC